VWIAAVLAASGVTLALLLMFVLGHISSFLDLGRAAQRFRDEAGGLAGEISHEASEVRERAGKLQKPGKRHSA
jgi:hypothetical protein